MTPRPAYQPSAVQELCLRAALSPGQPGRDAWRRVLAAAALEDLDRACRSLLPLVYRNLAGPGADDREVDGLKERYLETWSANQRIFDCVLPLLRALEQAGIDVIVLKGLAMIAGFYRDPGLRPMADVDVLVAPAEAERAGRVAVGAGWQPRYPLTAAFLRVKHAGPFDHP
ncbi:MAG TPA: nucleotidyltransferase family protein, partial [Candidatus Methylomirabilis sp.]|nr:nucleotidyltransferase family protein [Candidatus Methylomirabilis sp.]